MLNKNYKKKKNVNKENVYYFEAGYLYIIFNFFIMLYWNSLIIIIN